MLDAMFNGSALWFAIPAVAASLLFLIKIILLFTLGDGGDGDGGGQDLGHTHSGTAAEIFSIQAVSAFFMGFGWGGLGSLLSFQWSVWISLLVGVGCGLAMLVFFVGVMRSLRKMSVSGNIDLSSLNGATGEVTSLVPAAGKGTGEVRLIVGDRERRCMAVSAGGEISTRTRVRVVATNSDNTVTLEDVSSSKE